MTFNKTWVLIFFSCLPFMFNAFAEERPPHGLSQETPMAFSPSAFEFFHPKTQDPNTKNLCPNCSPLPMAAQLEAEEENRYHTNGEGRISAGVIGGIVFGLAFVVLMAMGVYYVLITRRTNMTRTNSVQPGA